MKPTTETTARTEQRVDLVVPDGCPLCDGPLHLRLTPGGARSLCTGCVYLASPEVTFSGSGRYELTFLPVVEG